MKSNNSIKNNNDNEILSIFDDIKFNDQSNTLLELFTDNVVLTEFYHNEFILEKPIDNDNNEYVWRLKERMKTSVALLVVCLNIGTNPPDIIKPNPCARKECWIEPILPKQKGLEIIGNALQSQYERLHSKVKYKQCLDPTVDDLRRICVNLRKSIKNDRLLFHYNGHGVPRPTKNGEIWLFGRHYTHYLPISIHEVHSWLSYPTVYLFDCSAAGVLISQLLDNEEQDYINNNNINDNSLIYSASKSTQIETIISNSMNAEGHCIILAACKADEILPMNPLYPADIFTCCLTTPIPIALRHLIIQNPFSLSEINLDLAENFPGKENDRKTPRGELNWIFTAITDTIAFSVLPPLTFQKIFRQDMMVASLFRNLLLAKRIMKTFSCTPQSWPIIPDTSHHNLWQTWDLTAESCLLHVVGLLRGLPMIDPKNNIPFLRNQDVISPSVILNDYSNTNIPAANLPFFTEQLTAFEIWLNFGNMENEIPIQLPILLQVLLSQTHRLRALVLLKRYLSLGPTAINSTLVVGIFPYILKLLQSPINDIKQVLVCIWSYIIGHDPSCRQELLRDKSHNYFIQYLNIKDIDMTSVQYKSLAMFILTEICNGNPDGQQLCLQQGLHRLCTNILSLPILSTSNGLLNDLTSLSIISLIQWTCLCLQKLLEDFIWAKYLCITEAVHTQLYPLLQHVDPIIRAAATLTLGENFGASLVSRVTYMNMNSSNGNMSSLGHPSGRSNSDMSVGSVESLVDPRELREAELQLAITLLDCCIDGNILVRYESIVALSKFVILPNHLPCFAIITKQLINLNIQIDLPNTSSDDLKQSTSYNKNNSNRKLKEELENAKIYPWNLLPHQTQVLVDEVIIYLESQGIGSTPPITPEINEINNQNSISIRRPSSISPNATLPVAGMMAAAYVRFWLAIYEVRGKDPNISVAKAANLLCLRIHDQISIDDRRNQTYNESFNELVTSITGNEVSSNELNIITENNVAIGQYQPLSPMGLTSKLRDNQKKSSNKVVKPLPFENIVNEDSRNNSTNSELSKSLLFGISNPSGSFLLNSARSTSIDSTIINDHRSYEENADNPFEMPVSSYYYWTKKILFKTNKADEFSNDPFSSEGNNRLYREMKYSDACCTVNQIVEIYKILDDSSDYYIRDRKTKEENQMARSAVIAAMPSNLVKFDQKLIINIENTKMTSSILFHPFHDIIATTDGRNVKMWSIATGNMLVDVLNSHNHLGSLGSNQLHSNTVNNSSSNNNSGRISSMCWINESYDSLLMLGSDNGNVTVWKDISESIENNNNSNISNESNSSYEKHSLLYSSSSNSKLSVASSFIALPDIADTNRGSGLISSWIQESGTLVAAGNSPTIRVWDLKYEKCVRVFTTGLDTCTTTIASKSVSSSFFTRGAMDLTPSQISNHSLANEYSHTPTWTFAGFADGTVSIFDEKLSSLSGKAQSVRAESSGWIIAAYTRHDLPQVITASVKGTVKFWDIRKMGVYKTLEVFKQPLTALAVHKCVPIIATGSQSQIIKIFTMGGDQLDRDIKYHDGFLGQRIGPVSCLAFHPYKMLLASGATDNIVSIYSPASELLS